MAKVKVLIEGYAKELPDGWIATSSSTLIRENGLNILVDPGINKELLFNRLKSEGLAPEDINIILMTHHHPDHVFNCALFPNAKILDVETVYENDKETEHDGKIPGTDLEIIPTPGHANEHCSLVVPTKEGVWVVAADVFWWTDAEEQKTDRESLLSKENPFTLDKKALLESRKKVLEVADFIIPGHGRPFKVEK